jgi:site-specific recombinase
MPQDTPAAAVETIPTWIEPLLYVTMAIVAIWVASSLFVYMRRRASNLTSAHQTGVKKDASPDFMKVDHKAREAAMQRGEAYDQTLVEREAAEAAAAEPAVKQASLISRLSGIASLLFSLFSLAGAISTVMFQVERMTGTIGRADQLMTIVQKYPIPVAVCVFVIGFHIYHYITRRRWTEAPKL